MQKENLSFLVSKAQSGDNQALNDLFTETYNDVYYFALKTVKDETLAADVTQETFVTVFQNISTLNDPIAYPAWSRQITYRHCLQYLKKQNREVAVDENEDGSTIFDIIEEDRAEFIPEENLDKEDFKKTILDMVDSLPEEQRTAVILYYYDELSIKEIAEIQGVTEGTVKSRLNYARKAIKASVESYEKKHNVKLHCAGVLPLLLWLFASDFGASAMSGATAQTVASSVSAATGTSLTISSVVKGGAKVVWSLWQKIVAGIVAAAVAIGGTVAVVNIVNKPDDSKKTPIAVITGNNTLPNDRFWYSDQQNKKMVGYMFANASDMPYFQNPDALESVDAFYYAFLCMATTGANQKYIGTNTNNNTEVYLIPISVIHKYMNTYFGRTYDCSNISDAKYKAFTADYVEQSNPVVRVEYDINYINGENLYFKILEDQTSEKVRTVKVCWYKDTNLKPDDTVSDWYHDEENDEYMIAQRYCQIVLKEVEDGNDHFTSWCIDSYLPS